LALGEKTNQGRKGKEFRPSGCWPETHKSWVRGRKKEVGRLVEKKKKKISNYGGNGGGKACRGWAKRQSTSSNKSDGVLEQNRPRPLCKQAFV